MTEHLAGARARPRAQVNAHGRLPDELRPSRTDTGEIVDQYGRGSAECERQGSAARVHEVAMRAALEAIRAGSVTLGRLGGAKQLQRLESAATLFGDVAERDNGYVHELRAANGEREEGGR